MMLLAVGRVQSSRDLERSNEQGWALLGLLLALGVMSIIFTSSIIPNVQMQVQRDKEIEMIYLQALAGQTLIPNPSQYLLLAGPPTKSVVGKTGPSSSKPASGGAPGQTPPVSPVNPANPGKPQAKPPGQTADDDDDDDDDD